MSDVYDISGSGFVVFPMETHVFESGTNDYLCKNCSRPRLLHRHDGFIAVNRLSGLSTDPGARYRGPHPRFTRTGATLKVTRGDFGNIKPESLQKVLD